VTDFFEVVAGAGPAEVVESVEDGDIGSEGGELPEEQCVVPVLEEGFGEDARALDGRMPFLNILGNVFEVRILGESEGGGLLAPACQAGETIGCVADDGEEVRD
jgi:hypothetical protein